MEGLNPIAAVIQPSALRPPVFVGLATSLSTITASIIVLRLWTNFNHLQKLQSDDYLCLLALMCLIWCSVMFSIVMHTLNLDPDVVTIEFLTKLVAISIASGNAAIYSAKLPLLFMLKRTFTVKKWFRYTCLFLILFGTSGGLAATLYASLSCTPRLHKPTPQHLVSCVAALTKSTIARGCLSLAIDVTVFAIPIPIIIGLNMPLRRKVGLGFAFATGLLAIAASALGLYFQTEQSVESSSNFANALLVTVIESAIVTTVSCTPAIHLFWTKHATFLRRRLGLGLLISSQSKSRLTDVELSENSALKSGRIMVHTHHYVELQELTGLKGPQYEVQASSNKE